MLLGKHELKNKPCMAWLIHKFVILPLILPNWFQAMNQERIQNKQIISKENCFQVNAAFGGKSKYFIFSTYFIAILQYQSVYNGSVYSIYICKLLLITYKCNLYNSHTTWNFFCVLFLTAMYFSVLYFRSASFMNILHSGILDCFRLCHICSFARVIR